MKIKMNQLRRLIRETIEAELDEGPMDVIAPGSAASASLSAGMEKEHKKRLLAQLQSSGMLKKLASDTSLKDDEVLKYLGLKDL